MLLDKKGKLMKWKNVLFWTSGKLLNILMTQKSKFYPFYFLDRIPDGNFIFNDARVHIETVQNGPPKLHPIFKSARCN